MCGDMMQSLRDGMITRIDQRTFGAHDRQGTIRGNFGGQSEGLRHECRRRSSSSSSSIRMLQLRTMTVTTRTTNPWHEPEFQSLRGGKDFSGITQFPDARIIPGDDRQTLQRPHIGG